MQKKNNRIVFNIILLILIGVAVVFYWSILSTVIAATILAFILKPGVNYIQSFGINRTISIIMVYLLIIVSIGIAMIFVVPKVISQGQSIFAYLNRSEVLKRAMSDTPSREASDTQNSEAEKTLNVYLKYDDKQEKITLTEPGIEDLIKQDVPSEKLLEKTNLDLPPEVLKADSLSQESLKKFMEIPILAKVNKYIELFDDKITFIDITAEIKNLLSSFKDQLVELPGILISNVSKIASTFAFVFMVPFISFFILKDKNIFTRMFNQFIPNRFFEVYLTITHKISELISSFLRALLVEVLIVGVLTAIVLSIIGVNYSILIGFFAGLANMVPYFGPFFGVIFAISSVVLTGQDFGMIIYVILGMWGVQILDNNIVYPIVIGKSTNIHPLYVFLTVVAGGYLFGVLGMILSVPVVYIVSEISNELYTSLKKYDII